MKKQKNSLLWRISGNNLPAPSYFFGTMHVRDNQAFRGLDFLTSCILSCDSFAAEFDLKDADPSYIQQAARIPNGQSIADFLSPKNYQKLAKIVQKETGYRLDSFKYSSPILLLNVLSEAQFQNDNNLALDNALYNIAQEGEKTMLGLESFEQQMSVFNKVDVEEQCRSLKKIATNFKSFRKELKKTSDLYFQGDIQELLKKAKRSIGGMRKVLLYDRNVKMVNSFEEFATQKSLFAAVGAGHLAGSKGVLRLLKKRGYTVEPVYY